MSGKGDCWDNAVMESFWAHAQDGTGASRTLRNTGAGQASIFEYIEVFYNRKRLHSSLGYVSPEMFEASLN